MTISEQANQVPPLKIKDFLRIWSLSEQTELAKRINDLRKKAFHSNANTDREAYFDALSRAFQCGDIIVTDALTAAVPYMSGVKVKQLEWEDADEGMCTKCRAGALGGHYELVALDGDGGGLAVNFHWGRPLSFWFIQAAPDECGPTGPKIFPTLDEAKAAAQADYEARILSALEPSAAREQALEEAARALDNEVDISIARSETCSDDMVDEFCDRAECFKEAAEFVRALSSPDHADAGKVEGDGWLPIESAPKDGTKFDVWMMPHGYRETDVFWSDIQDTWCREGEYEDEPTPLSLHPYAAFWRPLPSAPSEATVMASELKHLGTVTSAWNTRPAPAATDAGLVTIGFVPPMFAEGKGEGYNDIFRSVRISENYVAVVTRSQSEELLAAAMKDRLPKGHTILEQAETLDGRVSQTVRVDATGEEYERIVHADEAYGEEE